MKKFWKTVKLLLSDEENLQKKKKKKKTSNNVLQNPQISLSAQINHLMDRAKHLSINYEVIYERKLE